MQQLLQRQRRLHRQEVKYAPAFFVYELGIINRLLQTLLRPLFIKYLILGCYSGEDHVSLVEGGQRQIKNLKLGDRIWSLAPDYVTLIEDEVILMPHSEPKTTSLYQF